ncbi:MAG: DUF5688 family protein [Frisingicoccus sp.]|uniref:DUF5688 family protein n=1 Tax=Frisingicoccus sp. TaxID=1918627 RepID=UPI00260F2B22|nr:DUF5688 family protein [Frisingicoccus sp.]MDD6232216.1 DUF5688 family protein [Frisingicoccus sp.]MDY4835004.1 DUF5688 family protein [Frisingicoccus sp.]
MINRSFIIQAENYELHREEIERGPYIRHLDLALTCSQLIHMTPRELVTKRVNWDMLKDWDMSPDELMRQAAIDSKKTLAPTIEPMSEVIKGFLVEEFLEKTCGDVERALEKAESEYRKMFALDAGDIPEIYVISNELRIQGAAVVFYTDILEKFAQEQGSNLILLPSSIHEWLVLLESEAGGRKEMEAMVREANMCVVRDDEVLSNHVYRYRMDIKELEILGAGMGAAE